MSRTKFLLSEDQLPTTWYNVVADLPKPLEPMLHPGTRQPLTPDDLAPLFPAELIAQEFSTERETDIPGAVLDVYRQWRPSPLVRARRLERALDTPARIYFKNEGVSPAGSHKPNTAVPQAYYNKQAGVTVLEEFRMAKLVVSVDEDVDPESDADLWWAMATRLQADQDLTVLTDREGFPLDPTQSTAYSPALSADGRTAKAHFDCTVPYTHRTRFHRPRFTQPSRASGG
ncbi:hypothetical protein ACIO8H_06185 [Streptomyces sp. NPDC087226]|uniref:hypothetical protein n=1 Tax=Streptomyces sp. NPDC087226 TaxID=3365771 RepID=UPI0037F850F2